MGLLAGLGLRVAAMLAASAGVVVFVAFASILTGASPGLGVVLTIGSLFAFQAAYLLGVALVVLWTRWRNANGRGGARTRL